MDSLDPSELHARLARPNSEAKLGGAPPSLFCDSSFNSLLQTLFAPLFRVLHVYNPALYWRVADAEKDDLVKSHATFWARLFLFAAACFAHAQTGFQSLGTWSTPQPATCASGFYGKNCFSTIVSCPGTTSLIATYGYALGIGKLGTIVMFTGGGGTSAGGEDYRYAGDYSALGYTLVQVVWASDWEDTGTNAYSIKNAACRPATFLNFVYTNPAIFQAGKFCAQGGSGGAGALGYSLAWYGAGSGKTGYPQLDNVELIDGPMFSDLKQGCAEYHFNDSPNVPICRPGTSQLGCTGWGNGISLTPQYLFGAGAGIGVWTGDPSCTVGQGTSGSTSPRSNTEWIDQSIVSPNASFNYPNTKLAGWLCETGGASSG